MSEQTNERVRAIIAENLGVEPSRVVPDIKLCPPPGEPSRFGDSGGTATDLGADSLDIVELVMACEEEFAIEIHDDESEALNRGTVQDLYDLIGRKDTEATAAA